MMMKTNDHPGKTPTAGITAAPFPVFRFLSFLALLLLNAGQSEAQTVEADTIKEVAIYGRRRVSPLKRLTVEPLAWETSITYITGDDLKRTAAVSLFDALKYSVNGTPSTQGRRKKHYYLLRGQNMASDYAINGVSLSTNGAGPMSEWVEAPALLPAAMIESVEVVRSGNSLLLGFSGLNGVVNIKTKTFDTLSTQLEAEYGTFNSLRCGGLHGGKFGGKAGVLRYAFSLFRQRTDGPEGRHSYEDLWNLYGKITYSYHEKAELHLESFYTYGVRHVTQAVFDRLAAPQSQLADLWEYDPMRYSISTARLKITESAKASTEVQFGYILNRMDLYPDRYYYTSTGAEVQLADSVKRNRMLDEPDSILMIAVFQAFSPVKNNVVRTGVMYASSANYAHGKSKKSTVAATLLDQHTFGKLDVHAGVKVIREYYDYYVPGQGFGDASRAVTNRWQPTLFNLSAGVSYQLKRNHILNFVLNSGTLPIDGTALQQLLDANGAALKDEETGKTLTGWLKREVRTGVELGWKHHAEAAGHFVWTCFFLKQKNTSEFTRTPYFDDSDVLRYYMKNIDLNTCGVELSYHSPAWREAWSCNGNLSCKYVGQTEHSSRKRYTRQPPFIANAGVSYARKAWEANMQGKYVSRYTTDRFLKEDVDAGDYFNFDANLTFAVPRTCLRIYGSAINIFDVRYATVSPIYPDFGRQLKAGVRVIF
ncbi:MAG: TonB-dependent receptor plug domain-containing protein [Bacteroidales bacterium]|jgi:iron complex outermembrane receptor protein|nr:TonB-dependent receptor plug domain-containing protein [Bacteroidales bacterium]